MSQVSLEEVNSIIGSVEAAYYALVLKGIYVPKLRSKVINARYLLDLMLERAFFVETSIVKLGIPLKKISSLDLYEELLKL
jgi:hypothetical protein